MIVGYICIGFIVSGLAYTIGMFIFVYNERKNPYRIAELYSLIKNKD